MKSPHILLALLGSLLPAHAATILIGGATLNGNFEDSGTGTVLFSLGTIPNWASWTEVGTASANTGVYTNGGDRTAYIEPGGAIRNMTSYTVAAGDTFTFSFDNERANRGSASMQLVYDDGGVITAIPTALISGSPVNTLSGSFTVQSGDAWIGKTIGVGLFTSGNYPEVDNVTLSVQSVPEASAMGLVAMGLLGLISRRRRAVA